jgi:transcriptional regulator of aroF, aroG, tyrA and aromatic amino acid transport
MKEHQTQHGHPRVDGRYSTVRWCIETDDRIGMVRDIVVEIAALSANLEAMEAVSRFVYVRLQISTVDVERLRQRLLSIHGVKAIDPIDKLPFEADEEKLIRRVMHQEEDTAALSFYHLTANSPAMQRVVEMARMVAAGDAPVLITGETGTGKELLARAIHQASKRSHRRFVPLNCAAIPDALLESELFGYAEGAFTGAQKGGRPGLFEVADGGTLFLDEVGEMNPAVQAKVLRALADGEIRRIGSNQTVRVNVRILAATNRNLTEMMQKGTFREDLYFRLNVIPLHIPPLRERREDILPIATRFLEQMNRKFERSFYFTEEAKAALLTYDYPGNVRELQNIVERACYLNEGSAMTPEHLSLPRSATWSDTAFSASTLTESNSLVGPVLPSVPSESQKDTASQVQATGQRLKDLVLAYEISIIQQAIQETGSVRAAARRLGTTHTALSNKLKAWKVQNNTP